MECILEKIDLQSILPLIVAMVLAAAFMVIAQRIDLGNDAISRMTAGIVTGVGYLLGTPDKDGMEDTLTKLLDREITGRVVVVP